jgi:multiple sugar transport system permease protein
MPFALIMLRTTFAQIPIELEEAARVDGCPRLSAFFRITLPLARPSKPALSCANSRFAVLCAASL